MTATLMKGHTWAKGKKKLEWPASAEVKVDEVRLDVRFSGDAIIFRSYADKPLANLEQFALTFANAMHAFDLTRLDMGVLVNKNFNDTYRYVRSTKGIPADLLGAQVEFILFDLPDFGTMPYIDRIQLRRSRCNILNDYGLPVSTPRRVVVHNEEEVMGLYGKVREEGYEGLMVKDHRHTYEAGKRTNGWLKVKPEEDADAVIVGVNEAISEDGTPLGRVGSLQGKDEEGQDVAIPGIDHDTGRLWFENPALIVGEWVEFKYMERDRQGGYRHPRFNRVREAKV